MPEYNEPNLGGGSLGGSDPFGDTPSNTVSTPVDTGRSVRNIASIFNSIESGVQRTNRALERMLNTTRQIGQNMRRWSGEDQGNEGSGTTTTSGAVGGAIRSGLSSVRGGFLKTKAALSSPTGGYAALTAFQMGQQAVAGLDQRVNNAYGNLLANDRLAVLYQQTQGITQNQYYDNYRQPLQQFRLGAGGINTLLGLEAQTGIRAQGQAASIQGLSAASGYAYGTQEFAQMIKTLANPMVNNRMTMTLGTGLYGPGGSQRSMTDIFQSVVRGAGLTNERLIRSGKQVGSLTRARLSSLGIPEDMHDLILQYAEENVQFQRKTGGQQGMYDPSKQAHRQEMGIEENFATQREETTRLAELRDEKFYNRQKDNMAALEKNTQAIIGLQTSMEEVFQSVIGKRISYRGGMVARAARGLLSVGMIGAGVATGISAGWTGVGLLAAGGLISSGTAGLMGTLQGGGPGDGTETESTGKGKSSGAVSGKQPTKLSNFNNLNSTFRERLDNLINASGGKVWVGTGFRSSAAQRQLFLRRYTRTDEKTSIFWDGSYWKNTSGEPDAAPPGMSMHEIGLAADMDGDLNWLQQNAARFGLKTFADVNNEPWHVQPAELPNSRRQYEAAGAPWGTIAGAERLDPEAFFMGSESRGGVTDGLSKSSAGRNIESYSQMSISDSISAARASNRITMGGMVGRSGSSRNGGGTGRGRKTLKGVEVAKILWQAGFRGDDLIKALAISHRESSGWNVNAFNPNKETKDLSYGLFQINMLGDIGKWRQGFFGIKENEELFNPETNAAAAYKLYALRKKEGKDPFYDWGGYKGKEATYSTDLRNAYNVARSSGYLSREGDPVMPVRGGGGSTVIASGDTINISPNIYIQSTGSTDVDARRAAEEFSRIFSQNLKIAALRRS